MADPRPEARQRHPRSPSPSDPNSYVEKEARIVANTSEVTVDFAGDGQRPVERFFVSSNLGRVEAVRDRNRDGVIDAADAERVIYRPPNGEYLYPRLTEALTIRGYDFTVTRRASSRRSAASPTTSGSARRGSSSWPTTAAR